MSAIPATAPDTRDEARRALHYALPVALMLALAFLVLYPLGTLILRSEEHTSELQSH